MTRSSSKYPSHINPDKLPDNVSYDPRGRGRWTYRKSRGRKQRGKEIRLGNCTLTQSEIWERVDDILNERENTLRCMAKEFEESPEFTRLAASTQRDYKNCRKAVCDTETRAGNKLGDLPLDAWTTGAVLRYRNQRAKSSPSRSAHEMRWLKRIFRWGIQYEWLKENPAKEVELKGLEKPREHYVQDADYDAALNLAPWKLACFAHLSLLTGRREGDILRLHRGNVQPEGLLIQEGKTGKYSLILWSDELEQLVDLIREDGKTRFFHWSASGLQSAWQRLSVKMAEEGFNRFTLQDLRAKHATDLDEIGGNATENLRHSDQQVTRRSYLRKARKVVSLR